MDMGLKVCVLGASGFIGSNLVRYLNDQGVSVAGISRSVGQGNIVQVSDFDDAELLAGALNECDVVINAIGSFKPKDFLNDIAGPFDELGAVARAIDNVLGKASVKRFIQISSAGTIYTHNDGQVRVEDDVAIPDTWYGRVKLLEESYYEQMCSKHNIDYVVARVSNPFGNTRPVRHGFVDVLANSIVTGRRFRTFSTDRHARDFLYIDDMSRMLLGLCSVELASSCEIFNVGYGESFCLHELACFVDGYCGNVIFDLEIDATNIEVVNICTQKIESVCEVSWEKTSPFEYLRGVIEGNKGFTE